jgi:hypothetical protein
VVDHARQTSMSHPIRFRPIVELPCMVTGIWERFGVHVFEGHCTVEDMSRMEAEGDLWFRRNPGKLVELVVVYPSSVGMTMEERKRMQAIIKRWEPHRVASATTLLADGILGAMHRSILTGMLMIVRPPHPVKVFAATESAVEFLTPYVQSLTGPHATEDALREGVAELCTRFMARPRVA